MKREAIVDDDVETELLSLNLGFDFFEQELGHDNDKDSVLSPNAAHF